MKKLFLLLLFALASFTYAGVYGLQKGVTIINATQIIINASTSNHSMLSSLDFNSSGHTGFLGVGMCYYTNQTYNRSEIENLVSSNTNLFLSNLTSDVAGYDSLLAQQEGTPGYAYNYTITSDGQFLKAFVVRPGDLNLSVIKHGLLTLRMNVQQTGGLGAKTAYYSWQLFNRSGAAETWIATSALSDPITSSGIGVETSVAILNNDYYMNSSDRLVLKLYGNVSGGGADPQVSFWVEDNFDSVLELRTTVAVLTDDLVKLDASRNMTGELILSGNPTQELGAVPRQYVYNKTETEELIAGTRRELFLWNTTSDVPGYCELALTEQLSALNITSVAVSASQTVIKQFILSNATLNLSSVFAGIYETHLHANATTAGKKAARVYVEFYRYFSNGTEALLAASELSDVLTAAEAGVNIHTTFPSDVFFNAGERLSVKIVANVSGAGSNPDVFLELADNTGSRTELGFPSSLITAQYVTLATAQNVSGMKNFSSPRGTYFMGNSTFSGDINLGGITDAAIRCLNLNNYYNSTTAVRSRICSANPSGNGGGINLQYGQPSPSTFNLTFLSGNTQVAQLTSAGNFGLGSNPSANIKMTINDAITSNSSTQYSLYSVTQPTVTGTTGVAAYLRATTTINTSSVVGLLGTTYVDGGANNITVDTVKGFDLSAYIAGDNVTATNAYAGWYTITNYGNISNSAYGIRVDRGGSGRGWIRNGYALYLSDLLANETNYGVYQAGTGANNYFAGNISYGTTSLVSPLTGAGTATFYGGISLQPLSTPSKPTVTPNSGSGNTSCYYGYTVTAVSSSGVSTSSTVASPEGNTTLASCTLNATDNVTITWSPIAGAQRYFIYRKATNGSSTLGRIAINDATNRTVVDVNNTPVSGQATTTDWSGAFSVGKTKYIQFVGDYIGGNELPPGTFFGAAGAGTSLNIVPNSGGGVTLNTTLAYYNGSMWFSAIQIPNVASGFGNMTLMKSGGKVGIGTGATYLNDTLTVNGNTSIWGNLTMSGNIMPASDAVYNLGDNTTRWLNVRAQNVISGDYVFEDKYDIVDCQPFAVGDALVNKVYMVKDGMTYTMPVKLKNADKPINASCLTLTTLARDVKRKVVEKPVVEAPKFDSSTPILADAPKDSKPVVEVATPVPTPVPEKYDEPIVYVEPVKEDLS